MGTCFVRCPISNEGIRMNKTGFGFLRLPRLDPGDEKSIHYEILNPMVDRFLELGGRYFDTAWTYLNGLSEEALRKSLVERHPRDSFILADKLPGYLCKTYDDCSTYFEECLHRCGVDYFDVYLLHWLNEKNYAIAEQLDEFRFLQELKAQGRVKKTGFSYHDSPELLDRILTAHPEVDYVQLQINYLDWDSPAIQARNCYDIAVGHGKKVIVMEPVKGGSLAKLSQEGERLLKQIRPHDSVASWAIRFASTLPEVEIVLSGMNTMEQLEDNMRPLDPVTQKEWEVLKEVSEIIRANTAIGCTACGYCFPHCPVNMPIPEYFALYNDYARYPGEDWKIQGNYDILSRSRVPASACVACGQCEAHCPQKIGIISWLKKASEKFE